MMRESTLSADDLILPVFVLEGSGRVEPVASMPGVERQSLDRLLVTAEAQFAGITVEQVITQILGEIAPPTERVA